MATSTLADRLVDGGALETPEQEWLRYQLLRFPTEAARREWLTMPHPELDGDKPLDMLAKTPARAACVMGSRHYYPCPPLPSTASRTGRGTR